MEIDQKVKLVYECRPGIKKIQKSQFKKKRQTRITQRSACVQVGDVEDLEMTTVSRHTQIDLVLVPEEFYTVNIALVPRDRDTFLIRRAHTTKQTAFECSFPDL